MVLAQQGRMDEARDLIRHLPENDAEEARNKINLELQLLRDNHQEQAAYALLSQALKSYAATRTCATNWPCLPKN